MPENKKTSLATAVSLYNSGKKVPVVNLARDNPGTAAVLSKLITPKVNNSTHDNKGNRTINTHQLNGFGQMSREISNRTKEFKSMIELFPETELAAQILVSCVISPKDMTKGDINIVSSDDLKSSKISAEMLEILKEYFRKDYKIKPLVPKMLRSVLIEQGSDPYVIIPENSIDDLINGSSRVSFESIKEDLDPATGVFKGIGILGNTDAQLAENRKNTPMTYAEERFREKEIIGNYIPEVVLTDAKGKKIKSHLYVTDNVQALKMPDLLEKNKSLTVHERINKQGKNRSGFTLSQESFKSSKLSDAQLTGLLYKNKHNTTTPFQKIRPDSEMSRLTIGAPLVMRWPASAVIPVYTPGNEENHIGYFLLLDGDGNPLTEASNSRYLNDLGYNLESQSDMSTYMMESARKNLLGKDCKYLNPQQATQIYTDIIEADLMARVRNGVIGKQVTVARNEDIYRLMLARHFANQMTQLLYVPAELMSYFAYRYDERGIGISLLNSTRYLNSLRAMLLFSGVQARVKNSLGATRVNVKLDDIDGDPESTVEMLIHEFMKLRQLNFPVGITAPGDIADWVVRSGYEFNFTGHPGLPEMNVEASEVSRNYTMPDNSLEEELRKRTIMSMGLSPETVDNGFAGDFATSVVANNILLAKRVMDIQEIMVPQITDHMRKVAMNDGNLITELKKVVDDNFDDLKGNLGPDDPLQDVIDNKDLVIRLVVSEFLSNFEASLPQPDSTTVENQSSALDDYINAVNKAVENYVSSDLFTTEFGGQAANKAEEVKNILRGYFVRKWMAENNFMSDVVTTMNDLVAPSASAEDDDTIFNEHVDHINRLSRMVVKLLKDTRPVANAADRDITKITGETELSGSTSSMGGSYDSGSSGSDSGGMGGMGGFDLGLDLEDPSPASDDQSQDTTNTSSEETSSSTTTDAEGNTTSSESSSTSSSSQQDQA